MSENWKAYLKKHLSGKERIAVLGVGNPMKGDDAAGLLCSEMLLKKLPRRCRKHINILLTYDVPENYTGVIRKFKPSHVLIIDAALAGFRPGRVFILEKKKAALEEISSHKIPLLVFISYLEQSLGCRVDVLGIQARTLDFGSPLTPAVNRAAKEVADHLFGLFTSPGPS